MNLFSLDIETNQIQKTENLILICVCVINWTEDEKLTYVHQHSEKETVDQKQNLIQWKKIQKLLANPDNVCVGFNLGFDLSVLQFFGVKVNCVRMDTILIANFCDYFKVSLASLSQELLGKSKLEIDVENLYFENLGKVIEYCHLDHCLSVQLASILWERIQNHIPLIKKCLLLKGVHNLAANGAPVSKKRLEELQEKVLEYVKLLDLTPFNGVNLNSPKQVSKLIFDDWKLPQIEGKSTNATVLKALSQKDKRVDILSQMRRLLKLSNTFIQPLQTKIHKGTSKVYASFFLGSWEDGGTITLRTSSSNPNLQNISNDLILGDQIFSIRNCFAPKSGYIIKADYKQLEFRLGGYLSGDSFCLETLENKRDIHVATTAKLYNKTYEEVEEKLNEKDPEWIKKRRMSKHINFLLLYGGTPYKLKKSLEKQGIFLSFSEVQKFWRDWKLAFTQLTLFQEEIIHLVETGQPITTEGGIEKVFENSGHGKNQALNIIFQELGATVGLLGLNLVDEYLTKANLGYPFALVHDSVESHVYTSSLKKAKQVERKIKERMESVGKLLCLPNGVIEVDTKIGKEWS